MPQWASGRLTTSIYVKQAASASRNGKIWFDPQEVWKNNRVEREAEAWKEKMLTAYDEAGLPCE